MYGLGLRDEGLGIEGLLWISGLGLMALGRVVYRWVVP